MRSSDIFKCSLHEDSKEVNNGNYWVLMRNLIVKTNSPTFTSASIPDDKPASSASETLAIH